MKEKRREFLKNAAMVAGGVAVASVPAVAVKVEDIKNNSGKKTEVLYEKNPTWEFYYKQAK